MRKHVYPYFGTARGRRTPKWLYLNRGNPRVSHPRRVNAHEFSYTIRWSFARPRYGFSWLVNACTKDTLTRDGMGLPGHHGCGARRIRSNVRYLG